MSILQWIWTNIWTLAGLFILVRYGKILYRDLIFTPLAGGNGKVQMDELAKAVILAVFVFSAIVEAFRSNTDEHIFTDTYYFALLLSVCAIAAIKPLFGNMKSFQRPEGKNKDSDSE